ncbi:MAG: pentapeptide repeat-containing protein [Nostoc sp. S4]|nr:pentapeptide repeat-containing protein [Nostoc sp. S4]
MEYSALNPSIVKRTIEFAVGCDRFLHHLNRADFQKANLQNANLLNVSLL